jgi:4-amino-4-deoxy-L-arabinose transferase-like glycosyltransferase
VSFNWQTGSSAQDAPAALPALGALIALIARARERLAALRRGRPELLALLAVAALLDLWALSRNGWANDYYSAAVRSMSTSWHDFLYASLDPSGVMTVDKPPLALWVQALSVRAFGYHSLSILVPQALMGVASVGLLYDLLRRRFGRLAGFVGGLALALTPITVAISRHNNPDALLVLCCIAALWFAVRAMEDGSTRRLVLAGVCVGLGFETKMGVALVVVPGIVAAWMWLAPAGRGRLHALRQLLAGGGAMALVGGAWPALVELTPAADRPWVSGTSDNRVLSLIFEYNGVGRVDGQAGGPGGLGGGSVFGGQTGPLRLLNSALGGQGGWLLGFAVVSGLGLLVATRVRRADARSGWLLAVGGAFLTTAVLFSFAGGIFHPYYVSLLAPFTAALVGAGAAQLISAGGRARVLAPLAIAAGIACELAVLGDYVGQLTWLAPVLIALGVLAAIALLTYTAPTVRIVAVLVATGALMIAPGVWALDTLGHAANGTFPEGGPANVQTAGGAGGFGGDPFGRGGALRGAGGFGPPQAAGGAGAPGAQLFGGGAEGSAPGARSGERSSGFGGFGGVPGRAGSSGGAGGGPGGFGGGVSGRILAYVKANGGGTIAVASQSSAASSIIASGANVAGIGGFSGRESDVSVSWLAQEVRNGKIRWVLGEGGADATATGPTAGGFGGARGVPRDSRQGSKKAIAAAEQACRRVTLPGGSETEGEALFGSQGSGSAVLYDCSGRAAELERVGA